MDAPLEETDPVAGGGAATGAPPLRRRSTRRSSRFLAGAGRYALIWLSLAMIAATQEPLDSAGLLAVSLAGAVWLVPLRTASAGTPFALGPWVPTLVGTVTGLVCVAALNPLPPGLGLPITSLLGAALGIFLTIGIWECVLERTLGRRRVLVVGTSAIPDVAAAARRGRSMAFDVLGGTTGRLDDLTDVVTVQRPDLIVLTDDRTFSAALDRLLDMGEGRFRVAGLTSFCEYALGCVPLQHITPMWFTSLLHVRQRQHSRWLKRGVDIAVASLGLLLTAPLLALLAIAVRGTRGPVIYRQTRVGAGGRRFTIHKFRTMVVDAERPGVPVYASHADPRTTRIGAIMRRSHLDELPQLWNVLRGDMSLVGPRPERPEFISMLEDRIPFWSRRLLIKPGMTGWAQVHCGYAAHEAGAYEKLAYDFWYLRHRNLVVDLAICVRTLRLVLEIFEPARIWSRRLRAARQQHASR